MADWAIDPADLDLYKTNVEKAKQLMAEEAGVAPGVKVTIQAMSSNPAQVEAAQVIQNQLKQIGIEARSSHWKPGVYVDNWRKKNMDLMVGGNNSRDDAEPGGLLLLLHPRRRQRLELLRPQVDDLATQAARRPTRPRPSSSTRTPSGGSSSWRPTCSWPTRTSSPPTSPR